MENIKEIKRLTLADRVYEQMRALLMGPRLEPGDRINLPDTSERLEVSVTPLREALSRLKEEGFIVHRPNLGYFVAEMTAEEAKNLLEMRQALECFAVKISTPKMTAGELDDIERAAEEYRRNLDASDHERFLLDKRLHLRLAAGAGNQTLSTVLEQMIDRVLMKIRVEQLPRERGPEAHDEHLRLLEAIRRRDSAGAGTLLWEHLEHSKQYILAYLQRGGSASAKSS